MGIFGVVMAWAWAAAAAAPSVAITGLEGFSDRGADVRNVLVDRLAEEAVRTRAFSRVVGYREVQSVLGLEQQKQLLQCNDGQCLADVAGALGVDLLLAASLARLGDQHALVLKLMRTENATLVAAVTRKVSVKEDALLLDAIREGVQALVVEAGLVAPSASSSSGGRTAPRVVAGAGGAVAGLGVVTGVVGFLVGAVGLATLIVPLLVYVPTPFLAGEQRVFALPGAGLAGSALGAVLVVVALLVAVTGAAVAGGGLAWGMAG